MEYYVVITAHNEEDFINLCLESLVLQTLLPKKVIVVNDNSTDNTETIIDAFANEYGFIDKLNAISSAEHLPGSKVINAFNKGLALLDDHYDFIVKLDADLILPTNYFESIAATFKNDPTIGVAGGFIYETTESGDWVINHPMNKNHVRGAFKAYSKKCFEAINGLQCAMGWDTVDELLATYHGFKISTIPDLQVKHLRPTGASYNKKAKLLQGKAMYTMRYGMAISAIASAKMALKQGKLKVFKDNMMGYFNAKREKTPFLVTKAEGKFIREYRWKNILKKIF
ncbi:glycosyltransferase family 2 protein [Galbibacter sp. BG1]|uniref:glycosyltransferase family 2 protein n=1 Tax=Galbibacter sp. BG1 TaxID=1170699 RepID=UPI0015BAC77B|nr:glycosyltransferase family 2 protein [Galbibacter sp. BG1]QLE00475.1 glycosyltransferase family 2 protein [Galbibacter sp. BG1]